MSATVSLSGAQRHVLWLALRRDIFSIVGNTWFCEYQDVLSRNALWEDSVLKRSESEALFDK